MHCTRQRKPCVAKQVAAPAGIIAVRQAMPEPAMAVLLAAVGTGEQYDPAIRLQVRRDLGV